VKNLVIVRNFQFRNCKVKMYSKYETFYSVHWIFGAM